jgi:hypothetical protein
MPPMGGHKDPRLVVHSWKMRCLRLSFPFYSDSIVIRFAKT